MTASRLLASSDEIRTHLVDQLNLALRRPGMYGGEAALRILIDHLLFTERRPEVFSRQQRMWEERGALTATGVSGAFRDLVPGRDYEYGVASVYAEFAHRCGWLRPDRVLANAAYEDLKDRVRRWAGEDRTWADVTAEFGPPCVLFGGSNPSYGKTLGYLGEDPDQPMVFFHLWNGSAPGAGTWSPEHEQPILLAVRYGEGPFHRTFTFTPEGRRRKPAPVELCRPR